MEATISLPETEVRALVRGELRKIAEEETRWLDRTHAAKRIDLSVDAFDRLEKLYGLPKSKLNAKVVRYLAADVDAMMMAHLQRSKGADVIEFASVKIEKLAKGAA